MITTSTMIEGTSGRVYAPIGIDGVRRFLPHRHPFLLVDRVLEIRTPSEPNELTDPDGKVGVKVTAIKCISYGEAVFQGHFPDFSILPGVMILEAMAQTSSFSVYPFLEKQLDRVSEFQCILAGIDEARFRRPVVPGDVLKIETEVTRFRRNLWGFHCVATVDGQKAAEAQILANLLAKGKTA